MQDTEDSLSKRIVKGYLIIWNSRNMHGEIYVKGCAAKSIQERGPGSNSNYQIKFLNQHRDFDPLALFAVLKEDETGLYFETKPLDEIDSADRVLTQLRSGTLNNFSPGFNFVWDKIEYDPDTDSLIVREINLYEGSVVSIPSEMETFAVRNYPDTEAIDQEIETFIGKLPRNFRLEARKLFAQQKSLIVDGEPLSETSNALTERNGKPAKKGVDLNYIINNL